MVVNEFDRQMAAIILNQEGGEQDLQKYRDLLEALCEELKQVWHKKGLTDSLVSSLIDDCLCLVTRPLEEHEWDEMQADQMRALFCLADQARDTREAVSWADRSRDLGIRILLRKLESEKQMIFINDSIEHLEGMAYRLLTWLNARNTLIQAYRSR
jgi:hypothetical protein